MPLLVNMNFINRKQPKMNIPLSSKQKGNFPRNEKSQTSPLRRQNRLIYISLIKIGCNPDEYLRTTKSTYLYFDA